VKPAALSLGQVLPATRACYGGLLLLAPGPVIRLGTGGPASPRAQNVTRVLGVRHLVQAALTAGAPPGTARLGIGAAVDLAHAASMIGLALLDRTVRRATLVDAAIETLLAGAGLARLADGAGLRLPGHPGSLQSCRDIESEIRR
jgi:hypothetical protein